MNSENGKGGKEGGTDTRVGIGIRHVLVEDKARKS